VDGARATALCVACVPVVTVGLLLGLGCGSSHQMSPVAQCGNGIVEMGEECDDGNDYSDDGCVEGCVLAACGDGYLHHGVEQCDDGNVRDDDGCDSDCTTGGGSACGNGVIDIGEECDDGNASNADACLATCQNARCGDGFAQIGVEECDDGNKTDDDGCRNDCTLGPQGSGECPGLVLNVSTASATSVVGTTESATDSSKGSCGGQGGKNVVYGVVPKTTGWLIIELTGINGGDGVLYVRSTACESGPELDCVDDTAANGVEYVALPVEGGDTYWVFVDGADGKPTPYSLKLTLQNEIPGDVCPGQPIALDAGKEVVLEGDTALATSNYKGENACEVALNTKDLVYSVVPKQGGTLTATLQPVFDGVLYARVASCTNGMQVACADNSYYAGGPETIVFDAVAGTKYSLFVDGYAGDAGSFELTLLLEP
jgi:cysteine-rich repeat protein